MNIVKRVSSVNYQLLDIGMENQFIDQANLVHIQVNMFICMKSSKNLPREKVKAMGNLVNLFNK